MAVHGEPTAKNPKDWHRVMEKATPFLAAGLLVFATIALHRELAVYRPGEIMAAARSLPLATLYLAFGLTALDYAVLTGYDELALRFIGHPLSYGKTALASFVSYAFGHNMGLSFLSGGGARLRFYSAWGFSAIEIAGIQSFCGMTFWMGFLGVGATVFLLEPTALPKSLGLPFNSALPLGVVCLVLLGLAFATSILGKESLRIRRVKIPLPGPRTVLAQVMLSSVDWALAAGVLYVLLPPVSLGFSGFLGLFMLAQAAGLASQMPGGLGVFETALLLLLKPHIAGAEVMAALLVYRGIYYLFPLVAAALVTGIREAALRGLARNYAESFAPAVLSVAVFAAGTVLLLTGSLPAERTRLTALSRTPIRYS